MSNKFFALYFISISPKYEAKVTTTITHKEKE